MRSLDLKILRRGLALIRDLIVWHDLPLVQTAQASLLDRRDVDEHILAAPALRLNKPIPLLRIKPLHCSGRHHNSPGVQVPQRDAVCAERTIPATASTSDRLLGQISPWPASSPSSLARGGPQCYVCFTRQRIGIQSDGKG